MEEAEPVAEDGLMLQGTGDIHYTVLGPVCEAVNGSFMQREADMLPMRGCETRRQMSECFPLREREREGEKERE
jgi:hypothetical protein